MFTNALKLVCLCFALLNCYKSISTVEAKDIDSLRSFSFVDCAHLGLDLTNTGFFLASYSTFHNAGNYEDWGANGSIGALVNFGRFAIETPVEIAAWMHYKNNRTVEFVMAYFPALSNVSNGTSEFVKGTVLSLPNTEKVVLNQRNQLLYGVKTTALFGGRLDLGSSSKLLINLSSILYISHSYFYRLRLINSTAFICDLEPVLEMGFLVNNYYSNKYNPIDSRHYLGSVLLGPGCSFESTVFRYLHFSMYDAIMYGPYISQWEVLDYTSKTFNFAGGIIKKWGIFNQLALGIGITF